MVITSRADLSEAGVLPRVLPPRPLLSLRDHDAYFGDVRVAPAALINEVERSGLRGRGGAGFPTATKLAAVARGRRAVVVVNATEGEPASRKDKVLVSLAPHLVLDGAVLAARAVGAHEVSVCLTRANPSEIVAQAIEERIRARRDGVRIRMELAPDRYVSGEETALVNWLNGGEAKPTFVPPRPYERGVRRRPTLVQNAETLAQLALVARHGAAWFRALGTECDPGTALVSVAGAVSKPGVYEVPFGYSIPALLNAAGTELNDLGGILVGGYFGAWLEPSTNARTTFDSESLRAAGASIGCGLIAAVPKTSCGLLELARVARWLANENAGQCGPCVNGLPAIADAVARLYHGDHNGIAEKRLARWLEMVKGRGACKHPDGVARFVSSGLRVFADDIERHRHHGPCRASAPILPVPTTGNWR
jgi:NADH:ubiquinone oxidoreductase subunit F (NADH-binding)